MSRDRRCGTRQALAPGRAFGPDDGGLNRARAPVRRIGWLVLTGLVLGVSPWARGADDAIPVDPGTVVRWSGPGTEECRLDRRVWPASDGVCYFPIDLRRTGRVKLARTRNGAAETLVVEIASYPYPVQRIELPNDRQVHLSAQDLERVARENRRIGPLWHRRGSRRFSLPLGPPLRSLPEGGRFGAQRILNGEPRSPHSGSDYAVPEGTPVLAVANGVVALAEEHFFAGNSVFIDHGEGLVSMYFHLSEIQVEAGQELTRGQVLGRVGSTGRATGPHLHFGVRWHGARVDPGFLLDPGKMMTLGE